MRRVVCRTAAVLATLIAGIVISGASLAALGDPQVLSFTTSSLGSTVANLTNVPSGCVQYFSSSAVAADSHIHLTTYATKHVCGVTPGNTTTVQVDIGAYPPGHYTFEWDGYSALGPIAASGTFEVASPLLAFVTPICPLDTCVRPIPRFARSGIETTISFNVISASFPACAEVIAPVVIVDGKNILVSGIQTRRAGCVDFPPLPTRSVQFKLGVLDAGVYTVALQLSPNATNPTKVDTINGSVNAGILMIGQFLVQADSTPGYATAHEYYFPPFDHYFITADPIEIAALDARSRPFEDWEPTGFSFGVRSPDIAGLATPAVCRFFSTSFSPKSSHFYAAQGLGCEQTIAQFPDWKLESDNVFSARVPAADGGCSYGPPVFRLYNSGMGGAPNHRFTTSATEKQRMTALGWTPEGLGSGVTLCAEY